MNQLCSPQVLRLKTPSSQTKRAVWSKKELSRLKAFLEDYLSVKEIARLMNRTPASINSVLDRNKMRLRKYTRRLGADPVCTRTTHSFPQGRKTFAQEISHLPAQMPFPALIAWLSTQGISVVPTAYHQAGREKVPLYYAKGTLMPAYRVLMMANQLRAHKGLPLAHIPGITEF